MLEVEKFVGLKRKWNLLRVYARVIDAASEEGFRPLFKEKILKMADVKIDGWKGYVP